MNMEPMLLLALAEERRRRLLEEAERERLVARPRTGGKALASLLRTAADHLDPAVPTPQSHPA